MARYFSIFLGILILSATAFAGPAAMEGKLSIFRWNLGFRAEREPIFEAEIQESEFRLMVEEGKLPENQEIYSGCYLVHFEPSKIEERSPATAIESKPKSELFRICR